MTSQSRQLYKLLPNLYVGSWMMLEMPEKLAREDFTNILALYKQSTLERNNLIFKPIILPNGTRAAKQRKRKNLTFPENFRVHQVPVDIEIPFDDTMMDEALNYMEAILHTGQKLLLVAKHSNNDEFVFVLLACYLLRQGFPMEKIWQTVLSASKFYNYSDRQWRVFIDRADTDWETLRQLAREDKTTR